MEIELTLINPEPMGIHEMLCLHFQDFYTYIAFVYHSTSLVLPQLQVV